jgi:hypothetical protein
VPPLNPPSELTVEEVMESFKAVQKTDVMITLDSLGGGIKDGELQVFKASRQTGKSLFDRLDQTDWFDWTDPPDGLTSEEQGPCT